MTSTNDQQNPGNGSRQNICIYIVPGRQKRKERRSGVGACRPAVMDGRFQGYQHYQPSVMIYDCSKVRTPNASTAQLGTTDRGKTMGGGEHDASADSVAHEHFGGRNFNQTTEMIPRAA
jgi:hypothetical protein